MATPFSGGTYVDQTFTGASRQDILSNLLAQLVTAGWTNVAYMGGGVGIVGTFTVTIASPGVVTYNNHGLSANDVVILQTTGALPTGLSVNTRYFVRNPTTNTFELSTTSGGASINTSGSQSGTHTLNSEAILLQSATQATVTNPIRVRLKDNRSTCINVSIENQAGTVVGTNSTTGAGNLLPGVAKTYRIMASKYRWECFTPGATPAREYVMAGMLFVPSDLTGITDHGYMFCNSISDADVTERSSFRRGPNLTSSGSSASPNQPGTQQFIWNSNLFSVAIPGNTSIGSFETVFASPSNNNQIGRGGHFRWADDSFLGSDVLVSGGLTATTDEGKLKGPFYDMVYLGGAFAVDATDTFNGHNWRNLTNNNTGIAGSVPPGGIWVATS